MEAKESLILALLESDVDVYIISESTKAPIELILELKTSLLISLYLLNKQNVRNVNNDCHS